jgi:hypothetical protein
MQILKIKNDINSEATSRLESPNNHRYPQPVKNYKQLLLVGGNDNKVHVYDLVFGKNALQTEFKFKFKDVTKLYLAKPF